MAADENDRGQMGTSEVGAKPGLTTRVLAIVERVGNRLPDPATLFVILGVAVLAMSFVGARLG